MSRRIMPGEIPALSFFFRSVIVSNKYSHVNVAAVVGLCVSWIGLCILLVTHTSSSDPEYLILDTPKTRWHESGISVPTWFVDTEMIELSASSDSTRWWAVTTGVYNYMVPASTAHEAVQKVEQFTASKENQRSDRWIYIRVEEWHEWR